MRRLLILAIGAFILAITLLPMQPRFVVNAVSEGERLAMFSKPAVVRIVDGAVGQIRFEAPNGQVYTDRKSTRLNSSHSQISYAVFCLKKKKKKNKQTTQMCKQINTILSTVERDVTVLG